MTAYNAGGNTGLGYVPMPGTVDAHSCGAAAISTSDNWQPRLAPRTTADRPAHPAGPRWLSGRASCVLHLIILRVSLKVDGHGGHNRNSHMSQI